MTLTVSIVIILLLIGMASGMLSGLVGVGGGIIIVPSLIYFLSFSQKAAQGNSLGILLLPVGILGVIQYYKQGTIDYKVVLIVSLGFVVGNFLGSKFALTLSDAVLKKLFAILMVLIAVKMLFFDSPKTIEKKSSITDTHKLT
ncbi:MAG: sulfite exporter TauE/SafE family protein [Bacteroidota bacterium]